MQSTITSNLSMFLDNKSEVSMKINSTNTNTQISELLRDIPKNEGNSAFENY